MFILVGLGIVGGVGLIVVEILYHKHKVWEYGKVKKEKCKYTFKKRNGNTHLKREIEYKFEYRFKKRNLKREIE